MLLQLIILGAALVVGVVFVLPQLEEWGVFPSSELDEIGVSNATDTIRGVVDTIDATDEKIQDLQKDPVGVVGDTITDVFSSDPEMTVMAGDPGAQVLSIESIELVVQKRPDGSIALAYTDDLEMTELAEIDVRDAGGEIVSVQFTNPRFEVVAHDTSAETFVVALAVQHGRYGSVSSSFEYTTGESLP